MAIEFIDGFDHYTSNTNLARKWDATSSGNSTTGRFTGSARRAINANLGLRSGQLAAKATRVVGAALFWPTDSSFNTNPWFAFYDNTTIQLDVRMDASGYMSVTRNGTSLATASSPVTKGVWYNWEFKATIDNSGSFEVRLNGSTWVSGSSVDTQNTANAYSNGIMFVNAGYDFYIDDFYCLNTDGSSNNDFLGECRVHSVLPDGEGNTQEFTPDSGSTHYTQVDEADPDADTTYVSSDTVGHTEQFALANITITGSIAAVQTVITARKDDAGSREIAESCRSGSTDFTGSTQVLASTYLMFREIRETDPNTSPPSAWTQSTVNSAQFGLEIVT
jgi:hypothetical protein